MTIQMKALFLYLHMVLFVFQNEMWEFGRNLLSAKFGSERVRYRTLPTGVHANRPRGPDFSGVKFAFARFLFNICNLQVKETRKRQNLRLA